MPTSKRILRWVLAAFAVVIILIGAATVVLHTRAFQRYIVATISKSAQESTGARLEIGNWAFHWSRLSADLYNVVVHGTESSSSPSLLAVDHLAVGLKLTLSQNEKVNLRNIVIDHPVIHLAVNAQKETNIPPTPPKPRGSKPVNAFELAIGHLELNKGEIHYNDRSTPLNADLRDIDANIVFDPSQNAYNGTLEYRQAVVQYGSFNSFAHDLQARFTAAPSTFTLTSFLLKSGSSWFAATGRIDDYSNPSVEGSYQAALFTGEIANLIKQPSLPAGEVDTQATVSYRGKPGKPAVDNISVTGTLRSPGLGLDLPEARAGLQTLAGEYRLNQGALEVRNLKGGLFGGQVAGELRMANLGGTPRASVQVRLHDLSFAAVRNAIRPRPLPGIGVGGRFSGNVDASWQGSMQDLQARGDASFAASLTPASGTASAAAVPLDGALHLNYDGTRQVLALRNTSLHTTSSSVALDGELGNRANLEVEVNSSDLRELDQIAFAFEKSSARTSAAARPPEPLGLAGSASFKGAIAGKVKSPRLTGALNVANLQYHGTNLRAVRTNIDFSPSGLALNQGEIQISSQGKADFDVALGLRNWSFTPDEPIHVHLVAGKLLVEDLQRLGGQHYPVTGALSANIVFNGSEESPAGQGSIQLSQASAWDQPIQNLTVHFQGTGEDIHSTADLVTPAGSANVDLTFCPRDKGYEVQLKVPGLRLQELQTLKSRNAQITGLLVVSASGRGTFEDPQLQATVEFPTLQVHQQNLNGLKAEATVAHQQAAFRLDSSVVGAALHAHGTVNMASAWEATAALDSDVIQIGPLLGAFLPQSPTGLQGQLQIHGSLRGPLKDPDELQAGIEIPTFNLGYQQLQIAAKSPIRLNYRSGIVTLEHSELAGTGTDLQLDATVPVQAPGSLQAKALGTVDLHLIQILNPSVKSNGSINVNVAAQGNRASPDIRGTVRIDNGAVLMPHEPLGVEKVNGEFDFGGGRVAVKSFSAQAGGGQVTLRGFATYQPSVQFNLGLNAKSVRLLYPDGVRTLFHSDLNLTGTTESALLNGQVVIDQLSLTQSFDLSTFADQFTGPSSPPAAGFTQNVKLNVGLVTSQQLALSSSQISMQGAASLQVQGTLADPVILGRTTLTGGDLFFQGRRFTIQNGTIQFVNPVKTEPVVNVLITTTVEQFNLSLNFVGPIDRLQTTYTADPALPPVDIINLLFTGHTTEAAQTSPTTPQSVLAGQLASQVSSRAQKLTGISSLTIDPQIGGNQGNAASQVAIQERVSKNLFFTFATDLTTTQGEVIQVEYQFTRKYSMSAVRDQTGGYQVEIKSQKKF
jgi:translocation and assembly module TamB